jgi:hypothetical protein
VIEVLDLVNTKDISRPAVVTNSYLISSRKLTVPTRLVTLARQY